MQWLLPILMQLTLLNPQVDIPQHEVVAPEQEAFCQAELNDLVDRLSRRRKELWQVKWPTIWRSAGARGCVYSPSFNDMLQGDWRDTTFYEVPENRLTMPVADPQLRQEPDE